MSKTGPGDTWRTPKEVINFIENKFGNIKIDLCSSNENKVCDLNITEKNNFLDDSWMNRCLIDNGDLAWCNPPFSGPLPFVKQCVKWAVNGYAVAGILNSDSSTKWFKELINAKALIMPIVGGRISFLDGEGVSIKGNNKPQFMFYLSPYLARYADTEYIDIADIY
jgi:phage N-6-adenine-methyltransferase